MKKPICPKCKAQLDADNSTLKALFASHDPALVETRLTCNGCDECQYTFTEVSDFITN